MRKAMLVISDSFTEAGEDILMHTQWIMHLIVTRFTCVRPGMLTTFLWHVEYSSEGNK